MQTAEVDFLKANKLHYSELSMTTVAIFVWALGVY